MGASRRKPMSQTIKLLGTTKIVEITYMPAEERDPRS
jgi:hypothetical protein